MKHLHYLLAALFLLAGCTGGSYMAEKSGKSLDESWNCFYASYDADKLDSPAKSAYKPSMSLPTYPSPSKEELERFDAFKYWEMAFQVWFDKNRQLFDSLVNKKECFIFVNFRALGSDIFIDDIRIVEFSSMQANFSWNHGNVTKYANISRGIVSGGEISLDINIRKYCDAFESNGSYKIEVHAYKPTLALFRKLSTAESADEQYAGMVAIPMNMPR